MTAPRPEPDDVEARFRQIMDAEFGTATPPRGTNDDAFNLTRALDHADPDPEPDEQWLPPDPGPLPRPTGRVAAGVAALVLALVWFVADLTAVALPPWLAVVGIGSFVAGLALLLTSLPRHRRDPWDDGSRV